MFLLTLPKSGSFQKLFLSISDTNRLQIRRRSKAFAPTRNALMLHFKVSNVSKIYMEPELKFYNIEQNLLDIINLTYYVYFIESKLSNYGMEKRLNS